ncbi:MAG TPA: ferredoxin, partial [Chloroflexota bacterium]
MVRVRADRRRCIGAASCVILAPRVFDLDADGKVVVLDPMSADDEIVLEAAESCPVDAIEVFDDRGRRLYP